MARPSRRAVPRWCRQVSRSRCTRLGGAWLSDEASDPDRIMGASDIEFLRFSYYGHYVSGSGGTGKTHIGLALGLAACQQGIRVRFTTAAALVHELMEARDERRLRKLQQHLASVKLLIIDELGYVPFTAVGAELLFEILSQRYERASTLITSNLPFDEWTSVFGSERLTGALLDRLTHHVNILEMNGDSYRLASSAKRQKQAKAKEEAGMT